MKFSIFSYNHYAVRFGMCIRYLNPLNVVFIWFHTQNTYLRKTENFRVRSVNHCFCPQPSAWHGSSSESLAQSPQRTSTVSHEIGGSGGIWTHKGRSQKFYRLSPLAIWIHYHLKLVRRVGNAPTRIVRVRTECPSIVAFDACWKLVVIQGIEPWSRNYQLRAFPLSYITIGPVNKI